MYEIIARRNVTFYLTINGDNFQCLSADYAVRQRNGNWLAYKIFDGVPSIFATLYAGNYDFDFLFDDELGATIEAKVKM